MDFEKEKELELIKSRLINAYLMTIQEQKKWSKKINELETMAAEIEKSIGQPFSDEVGIKLLVAANKELSKELSEQRWGAGIEKYFNGNPKVNELLDKACSNVDQSFKVKSITVLKLKIEEYKKAFKFIEKSYGDTKTLGIRELTPDENKKTDKELQQIGWM